MLKITDEQKNNLNVLAMEKLNDSLRIFGNDPGPKQIEALTRVIETYTEMGSGRLSGRYAFPLPTGTGKTRSIIAWLSAVNDLKLDSVSVTVCASKVEALCDLKRALEKEGIPSGKIGLIHSYKYDERISKDYRDYDLDLPSGYASECSDRPDDIDIKQILLLTHQRVKGNTWLKEYNHYHGKERDLMIWDETLIASETFIFPDDEISSAISRIEELRKGSTSLRHKALEYLKSCLEVVIAEIERQKRSPGSEPEPIRLPFLNGYDLEEFKASLGDLEGSDLLRSLLDVSQERLRVLLNIEQGGGALTFKVVIPGNLKNIVILDASHNVRLLAKMDDSIQTVPIPNGIITYENVQVHQLWYPSGRTTMEKEFAYRRGSRKISKEIAEVIKSIPEDECVLIFVFKKRLWLDQKERLLCDLKDSGIDIDALISGKPRIVVLTWGNETSLSQYSYCSHIIFAGVLHRSHLDIGSAIIGQRQDLLSCVSNKLIRRVLQSEIVHCLYQAFSRGSCRVIQGSTTKSMNVWLIHNGKIQDLIYEAMPRIHWDTWEGKYLIRKQGKSKIGPVIQTISNYLSKLQFQQISIIKIKKELNLKEIPFKTFRRALDKALINSEWTITGRSLVKSFPFYFGSPEGGLS